MEKSLKRYRITTTDRQLTVQGVDILFGIYQVSVIGIDNTVVYACKREIFKEIMVVENE